MATGTAVGPLSPTSLVMTQAEEVAVRRSKGILTGPLSRFLRLVAAVVDGVHYKQNRPLEVTSDPTHAPLVVDELNLTSQGEAADIAVEKMPPMGT